MCLIAMAIGMSSQYPWICISNRDEFNHRPTRPLQAWGDEHGIVAGQDLQSLGSWLGVNARGDFAALTNIRNSALNKGDEAPSRGLLVTNYLREQSLPGVDSLSQYSGFNLIAGNLKTLSFQYLSNSISDNTLHIGQQSHPIKPGLHTLSNASLNCPWPKTEKLSLNLNDLLSKIQAESEPTSGVGSLHGDSPSAMLDSLMELLQDKTQAPDECLPHTGVPLEWERMLSAIQIVSPHYGTRSSTAMILDSQQRLHIREVSYHPDGSPSHVENLKLDL